MLVGTLVNTASVAVGSLIGLLVGKRIPAALSATLMQGLGLITVFLGITGLSGGENALIPILSIVLGAAAGELCDLDGRLRRMSERLEKKFDRGQGRPSLAEGFVTASLVFCVGAMTIVGALQDGLSGDHTLLFTKATLDFVSAMIFASTLGIGVLLAAGAVFAIQGSIALLASLLAPLLNFGSTIAEITVVGSVLILGLGLNILGVTKIKVMNLVPACLVPILLCRLM